MHRNGFLIILSMLALSFIPGCGPKPSGKQQNINYSQPPPGISQLKQLKKSSN